MGLVLLPSLAGPAAAAVAPDGVRDRDAFGVVLAGQAPPGADAAARLRTAGATWYHDYTPRLDDEVPGRRKAGMVRGGEANRAELGLVAAQARARPGRAWLVFNEPDLPGQDYVSEAFLAARGQTRFQYYAALVRDYARVIKAADPTAALVGPNLFDLRGQGLEWLRSLRAAYQEAYVEELPFDVLGVHLYSYDATWRTLPQLDLAANAQTLAETLAFAETLPQRPRVWVTELGSLWIYSDLVCGEERGEWRCCGTRIDWPALEAYTREVVRMLGAAGVERWFFFSTNPIPDPWASVPNATYLSDERDQLTPVGRAYLAAVAAPAEAGWVAGILARLAPIEPPADEAEP